MEKIIFAIKLAIWFVVVMFFCFAVVMPQYNTLYNAAMIDKWDRLKSIDEPKIILAGDSNVAFGFDSQKIQEAFDMPVVNFGLHGGLRLAFHTDMIKPYINSNDIVIIAPSGYQDSSTKIYDYVLAWTTIENKIGMLKGLSYENYTEMLMEFPTYFNKAVDLWYNKNGNLPQGSEASYSRGAFNEYGDNAYPRPYNIMTQGEKYDHFGSRYLSDTMRIYLNKYNDYVKSRNARVFISAPPISLETLPDDIDLENLQKQLEEELESPMISNLQDYVYPPEYFYDTYLHLNDTGMAVRTEQLISDLRKALDLEH